MNFNSEFLMEVKSRLWNENQLDIQSNMFGCSLEL